MQKKFGKTKMAEPLRKKAFQPGRTFFILWVLILAGACEREVQAQASPMEPGSVLIFPLVSADNGTDSFVTVTNTNVDFSFDGANYDLFGDVLIHYYYVNGDDCDVTDRREFLSPGDTRTVLASHHNFFMRRGWLYVVCEDPATHLACDFDTPQGGANLPSGIIGDCIIFSGKENFIVTLPALSIKCRLDQPPPAVPAGAPSVVFGGSGSGTYDALPTSLYVSSFFEQGSLFTDELVLVPIISSNRDTADFKVKTKFLFYNNNETMFSQSFSFRCWLFASLEEIFEGAANLRGDPKEFFIQRGWASIVAESAVDTEGGSGYVQGPIPLMGLMIIRSNLSREYAGARLLHQSEETRALFLVDGNPSPSL